MHDIITDALHSTCEILHALVYAWMIERRLHGELVALAAPSLEAYLTRVNAPDLLWQYYEKNKNHAAAAKILDALATKEYVQTYTTIKFIKFIFFSLFFNSKDITFYFSFFFFLFSLNIDQIYRYHRELNI